MEVELEFDGLTITIKTESAAALFRVIKALQNNGRNPEIRYIDEEVGGYTCWQPLKITA